MSVEVSRTLIKSDPNANVNMGSWGTSYEDYNLIDVLTGETIKTISTINRSERMDSYNSDGKVIEDIYKKADSIINDYKFAN